MIRNYSLLRHLSPRLSRSSARRSRILTTLSFLTTSLLPPAAVEPGAALRPGPTAAFRHPGLHGRSPQTRFTVVFFSFIIVGLGFVPMTGKPPQSHKTQALKGTICIWHPLNMMNIR